MSDYRDGSRGGRPTVVEDGGTGSCSGDGPRQSYPIVKVPFHGEEILAIFVDGQVWIVLRAMCERFGVSMEGQLAKAKTTAWICLKEIFTQIPGDDQGRTVTCISLRSLAGWLLTIKAGKVKPEFQEPLLRFQTEAADALYHHFFEKNRAKEEARTEPRPLPPPPMPEGNGTIGRRRAAACILGPLRELAGMCARDEGIEEDEKAAKKQMARCTKTVHDEMRVRVGYHMGSAQKWEMVTEQTLGEVSRHLCNMYTRIAGQVRRRETKIYVPRQTSLLDKGAGK